MKRGKSLMVGWEELLKESKKPEGYSTVQEISVKTGRNLQTLRGVLNRLRKEGKVEAMEVRHGKFNHLAWVYKD